LRASNAMVSPFVNCLCYFVKELFKVFPVSPTKYCYANTGSVASKVLYITLGY